MANWIIRANAPGVAVERNHTCCGGSLATCTKGI
jgi:hypothetical protein